MEEVIIWNGSARSELLSWFSPTAVPNTPGAGFVICPHRWKKA